MKWAYLGIGGLTPLVMVLYATFSMGAIGGASAAINESVDYDDWESNISKVDEKIAEDIRNNSTGIQQDYSLAIGQFLANSAQTASLAGLNLGYWSPGLGRAIGQSAPFVLFGIVGGSICKVVRQLR